MNNKYGEKSVLNIEVVNKNGKTILKDSYFTAPHKIAKPFYDNALCKMKLCMLNVSAGILEGDSYNFKINVRKHAKLELYSQSYSKIFKMNNGYADQYVNIELDEGSSLYYLPHPIMPYEASTFYCKFTVKMKSSSTLIFRDIICCGRYKRDEVFDFKLYKSKIEIFVENKLLFLDNTVLEPENQDIQGLGFYEGYTHQGSFIVFSNKVSEKLKNNIVLFLSNYKDIEFGATLTCRSGIVVRILGNGGEKLKHITDELTAYIEDYEINQ